MSRTMYQHSYSIYDGKPYIYYNGVHIDRKNDHVCCGDSDRAKLDRTVIRTNDQHSNPVAGMPRLVALSKVKRLITQNPYALFIRNPNYSANNLFQ